ncbi:MAG: hypothetical protein PWQ43_124 [Rikenellaceae bacterium]|nr:hypothetical protein [Rikenellaceae bacterium]MDN5355182.1 hypothetical protein [Rikenellaceae bacterium]
MKSIENITKERVKKIEKLAISLGEIHNESGLFSKNVFDQVKKENNIIEYLDDFPYLRIFYDKYIEQFDENNPNKIDRAEAINIDLPFIGEKAIYNEQIDFMFYFEGSRQDKDKISITVLSHLWLIEDEAIINKFLGENKWWTKENFSNIKNRLLIDSEIIKRSYISDAVRFENDETNRKLICKEIKLFKPKLVVCVGTKARDLVGMRYYDFPTKFHHVRFPKYHKDNYIYEELKEILEKLSRE